MRSTVLEASIQNMQIISGITDIQLNTPTVVALGKFDGVHIGHRLLINDIVSKAKEGYKSVIFTFNPSPESLFAGKALPELTTVNEKRLIFDRLGVDILIEFPMTHETAAMSAGDFIRQYLVKRMRVKHIFAGTDLSFGYRGLGNAELIESLSPEGGYQCHIIDKVLIDGEPVSSTRIRDAVRDGDMEKASVMLGAPYRLTGTVSHGRRLGHTIGMPTANLIIPPDKVTGPRGVYLSRVYTTSGVYDSISNVGVKPTVMDDELLCCESYIYDFDRDIYGEYIEVELLKFIRKEMKFASVDELKAQMEHDIASGQSFREALD